MSEHRTTSEETPSVETVQERMNTLHDEANLGAGNDEPDPTTAENRPQDLRAGEQERNPD